MSTSDVERGLIARYLARVIARPEIAVRAARQVMFWLTERGSGLNLPLPQPIVEAMGSYYAAPYNPIEFERVFHAHRAAIVRSLDAAARESGPPEPLASNVRQLVDVLDIADREAAWKLVGLIACYTRYEHIQYLCNMVQEAAGPVQRAIAFLIDEPVQTVADLLLTSHELVGSGLVQIREGEWIAGHGGRHAIPARVNMVLDRAFASFAEMRKAILGAPLVSAVGPADYEHAAADRDLMIALLTGASVESAHGVNILLYGPPGSGKTELAKVAAAAAGIELYAAGEEVGRDAEQDRASRLADLVFYQRLIAGQTGTALMFDEMEDVAVHLIRRGGSKIYLNRLLERNTVPIVWTSNEIGAIDPAVLRRMTLAIELRRPPASQRRRIMAELLRRAGIALPDAEIDRLAKELDTTPAIIENAIRAARLSGGGSETIERAARGVMRAVSGLAARPPTAIPAFDPALTRASQDLIALADKLVAGKTRAFSLCLSGPPGTGKSAFARYLAGRLGIEVLHKRASDLLGMYVGQSEKNIADAFEEAREAGALLVFDEADSLLLDRRDAQRSWEISQVNEMLTWMEEHAWPVAFTTNLMDRIDTASLRRFTFHVRFEYLDRKAMLRAWQVFFGISTPPGEGLAWQNLTPGDFAKARKQAEVLGIAGDGERIAELIADISRGKPDARGTLGFTPQDR
jgi:SpoVK/Ycf46/Vps4 family AAA+-type ATPase